MASKIRFETKRFHMVPVWISTRAPDGEQREVVYLDIPRARLAELGIDPAAIAAVLGSQNSVVDAGNVRVGDDYLRIKPTGEFSSVQEIGDLLISSSDRTLIRLSDISTITSPRSTRSRKATCTPALRA